jgi:hypothetical protein
MRNISEENTEIGHDLREEELSKKGGGPTIHQFHRLGLELSDER